MKWARDGFLSEDFDIVLLISLRSANERSVEEVMVEHIGGEEDYKQMMKTAGKRCLIILEGLDEISNEHQKRDKFLERVIQTCTLLEEAKVLITSRPHACERIKAGRRVEIVGFGDKDISEFVEKSFTDANTVKQFLLQLNEYPHIRSLCYIPINLVMIVDLYLVKKKKLPSTLTKLYSFFIMMMLQRQIKKEGEKLSCLSTAVPAATEEMLCKFLKGIPKETVRTVYFLSQLAYCGFFDQNCNEEEQQVEEFINWNKKWKDPKIVFTKEDLTGCDIEVTAGWDGYGLLKVTHTHQLPTDTITYNFTHLSIQEFLCAVYMSTFPDQEQQRLLSEHFNDYPNVFTFLCGLTRLLSPTMSQFVFEKLKSRRKTDVFTALRCLYECAETDSSQSAAPFELDLSYTTLRPYECLCIGHVLSHYPVIKVDMIGCHIGDSGAEMLVKNYGSHLLQELILGGNDLTVTGVRHVVKIVMKG